MVIERRQLEREASPNPLTARSLSSCSYFSFISSIPKTKRGGLNLELIVDWELDGLPAQNPRSIRYVI